MMYLSSIATVFIKKNVIFLLTPYFWQTLVTKLSELAYQLELSATVVIFMIMNTITIVDLLNIPIQHNTKIECRFLK